MSKDITVTIPKHLVPTYLGLVLGERRKWENIRKLTGGDPVSFKALELTRILEEQLREQV